MIGMYKRNLSLLLLILLGMPAILAAPRVLSLDSCRTLAVENNKDLRKFEMEMKAAYYNRKSAFTNYLPKVSASGIYMPGKELSLLSDEQKATLSSAGDALSISALNQVGQGLVDALRTDTRNMAGAAVMLTQPIYMGGQNQGIQQYHPLRGEDRIRQAPPGISGTGSRCGRDILEYRGAVSPQTACRKLPESGQDP